MRDLKYWYRKKKLYCTPVAKSSQTETDQTEINKNKIRFLIFHCASQDEGPDSGEDSL